MILRLAYYGDPILRKKTAPVKEITDEIRQLVKDMTETMHAKNGIGLSANQVHHSISLFIICPPVPSEDGNEWRDGELRVFINPKLKDPSKQTIILPEGCLSIPGIYADIQRPACITVEAMDLDGKIFVETFTGWPARVIMHENDHINGVLFIDRVLGKERQRLEPRLRELKHPKKSA